VVCRAGESHTSAREFRTDFLHLIVDGDRRTVGPKEAAVILLLPVSALRHCQYNTASAP